MFSQLGDKLQDIFKDLRGHGSISETNINDALRQVRFALLEGQRGAAALIGRQVKAVHLLLKEALRFGEKAFRHRIDVLVA